MGLMQKLEALQINQLLQVKHKSNKKQTTTEANHVPLSQLQKTEEYLQ
jgi:hypothetical protein